MTLTCCGENCEEKVVHAAEDTISPIAKFCDICFDKYDGKQYGELWELFNPKEPKSEPEINLDQKKLALEQAKNLVAQLEKDIITN